MKNLHFFDNPHFREYVRLLHELHLAIKEGWDEAAEGEALRERMDESGSHLSGEEINSLNGISADFYSLVDTPPGEVSPITAEVMTDLESILQARKTNDFNKSLELLRKHVDRIPPSRLAYLRGSVWMEAREYPIAALFMQRASALEPDNSNFRYLALHSLWQADPSAAARQAQTILSDLEKYPPGLVLKAADILAHQPRARPGDQVRHERDSPIPILPQDFMFQHETSGEAEVHKLSLGEDLAGRGSWPH
jgi:hypothetical protein